METDYITVKQFCGQDGEHRSWWQHRLVEQIVRSVSYKLNFGAGCPFDEMVSKRLMDHAKKHTTKPQGRIWAI